MANSSPPPPAPDRVASRAARAHLWLALIAIVLLEALSGVLDFHLGDTIIPVTYLYLLPVLVGALYFGYVGGLGVPVVSGAVFHVEEKTLGRHGAYGEADVLFLVMLGIVGVMTARIQADRRRARAYSRQLEELAKAREELTALIVHDLRTPLAGLVMVLQMLAEQDRSRLPEAHQQLVDVALATGEDMAGMISDLLNIHAMENGALQLRKAGAEAAQMVESAVRQVLPLARRRGIEIVTGIAGELPELWVDDTMIQRVLVNLLGNALRFSPDGRKVQVAAERAGAEIRFSVADEGPGIPEALQQQVFAKFARVDAETSKHISTGLGLAFAKMAVEAHGGRIWVDSPWPPPAGSEAGRGTRFGFALPLTPPEHSTQRGGSSAA